MRILNVHIKPSEIPTYRTYLDKRLISFTRNMQQRLYVLIDKTLDPIYGGVQGGHAVAQWLLNHPEQRWNNSYLIYLSADIEKWKDKLEYLGIDYTSFQEPDLKNQTTSLAVLGNEKLFKNLKLIK